MKNVILNLIRSVLGKIILFLDMLFSPIPLKRSTEQQVLVDQATQHLTLYQFKACPFCVKVRRVAKKLNLHLKIKDAKLFGEELIQGGGMLQVPCLRIEKKDGSIEWMYESSDINDYLRNRFQSLPIN